MKAFKVFLPYVLLAAIISGLAIANYFHQEINTYVPSMPRYLIPALSLISTLMVAFFFWRREAELETERYEFVSVATHKFRTPLTGIKWAIEMLSKEVTQEEKGVILKQLRNSVERLIEIVDLLVDFAKIDSSLEFAFEAVSAREMLEDVISKYGPAIRLKNIKFSVSVAEDVPMIVIDKGKIQFVIDTLVDNSIKYTTANGTIEASVYRERNSVVVKIHDTGIGMSRSDIANLFKKFFRGNRARTADTEGMGLGLYAAKRIVDRHSGKLWAESEGKNRGSTFYLTLPISK